MNNSGTTSDIESTTQSFASQRKQAATILRQAHRRLDAGLDASDSCGWAIALLPESRAAQGLMIDALLASAQHEQANTLITTLLRQRPGDWRLWRRRAQALLALDRADEAADAIDRTLAQRPNHRRTLLLAADIASRRGDCTSALIALERADAQHPHDAHIARRLIRSLIDNHRADEAAAVLEQMPDAPAELRAHVFRAQGRLLDARLTLEDAAYFELDDLRRERLLLALIDVLDEARDWPALQQWRSEGDTSPALARRLAETCLPSGCFTEGLHLLDAAKRIDGDFAEQRSPVEIALRAACGESDEATRLLSTPRLADRAIEPAARCGPWLRGLLGTIVAEQMNVREVRRAGADPSLNVLDGLLSGAVETFDAALRDHADADDDRSQSWQAMRDSCARLLHNGVEGDDRTAKQIAEAANDAHLRQAA